MKIQKISNAIIDSYGNKYIHTIRTSAKKTSEIVSLNKQPLQKTVLKNGKVDIFDMGLFGKWVKRK